MKHATSVCLHVAFALLALSARADDTSKQWESDPLVAFANSTRPSEDRNGDGKPDLWRVFYPDGERLRVLKFDTTFAMGEPNLWYYYNRDGSLARVEQRTQALAGAPPDVVTTFGKDARGHDLLRMLSQRDGAGHFNREETVTTLGANLRRHAVRVGKNRWSFDEDPLAASDARAGGGQDAPGNPCPFNGVPASGFDDAAVARITERVAANIEVAPNCTETPKDLPPGVKPGPPITPQLVADVLREGLQCMSKNGRAGVGMRDELLANAIATGRKLKINCEVPPSNCVSGGLEQCGQTSHFGDADFPHINVNRNCMISQSGQVLESERKITLFHEMLHLTGRCGCQRLHSYGVAAQPETVEPCAQCCMASPSNSKNLNCGLCQGRANSPPEKNAISSYDALSGLGNFAAAMVEARKGVLLNPNSVEAWGRLADGLKHTSYLDPQAPDDQKLLFLQACSKLFQAAHANLDAGKRAQDLPGYDFLSRNSVFINCAPGNTPPSPGLVDGIERDYASKLTRILGGHSPAPADTAADLGFRRSRAMLRMVLANCGPMSATDGPTNEEHAAKHCYDLAQAYSTSMSDQASKMQALHSDQPQVFQGLLNEANRMGGGLKCVVGPPSKTVAQCYPPAPGTPPPSPGCPVTPGL